MWAVVPKRRTIPIEQDNVKIVFRDISLTTGGMDWINLA
jgi:hypothetical protein